MIKSIRFKDICMKFKNGINYIDDFNIIEACGTSFGGFCNAFDKGNGRRIDILNNEIELDVSTHASFNNKDFYFTRCYTKYRTDTSNLDQKQDIVKYANQLQKKLDNEKENESVVLPIIVYYDKDINFKTVFFDPTNIDCIINRTIGYSNCLLIKDHFEHSQQFFTMANFLCWQKDLIHIKDQFYYNFKTLNNILTDFINKFNYQSLRYDIIKNELIIRKNNKDIVFDEVEEEIKMMISILLDILMRAMILNPNTKNILNLDGIICSTYKLSRKHTDVLSDFITKYFHNFQIICF